MGEARALQAAQAAPKQSPSLTRSPAFERACDLLVPQGAVTVYVQTVDGRWVQPKLATLTARTALALHLEASSSGEAQSVAGLAVPVTAFGLGAKSKAITRLLNVDLDGGIAPAHVVQLMHRLFGVPAVTVTSGSGAAGRFRALVRVKPITVGRMQEVVVALLKRTFTSNVKQGAIEVYPSTKNTRLPAGLGGCTRFTDSDLKRSELVTPWKLLDVLHAAPEIDLERLAQEHGIGRRRESPKGDAPRGDARAVSTPKALATTLQKSKRNVTTITASRLWKHGCAAGERDKALFLLVHDCLRQRLSEQAAVSKVGAWIRAGGLAATRGCRSARGIEREVLDLPRRAAKVYTYAPPSRPAPKQLTDSEVTRLVAHVRAHVPKSEQASVGALSLRMLPRFKAAQHAGFDVLRVHSDEWREVAGRSAAQLRALVGLFAPRKHDGMYYRPKRLAGAAAHAKHWSCSFTFDTEAPARAVVAVRGRSDGEVWRSAILVSERVTGRVRRMSQRSARDRSGSSPTCEHIERSALDETLTARREVSEARSGLSRAGSESGSPPSVVIVRGGSASGTGRKVAEPRSVDGLGLRAESGETDFPVSITIDFDHRERSGGRADERDHTTDADRDLSRLRLPEPRRHLARLLSR